MTFNGENKPNFKKALEKANDLLVSSNKIRTFPFSIKSLIKEKTEAKVRTYYHAGSFGVDGSDFGTMDARLQRFNGMNIIFYN